MPPVSEPRARSAAGNATEDDLAELKKRVHLMQGDKKAYYEASQNSIRQNEEQMRLVKRENKELREALSKIKAETGTFAEEQGFSSRELSRLQERLDKFRKQYDEVRFTNQSRSSKMQKLLDQNEAIKKEAETPFHQAHESARKIRALENRLDKVLVKHNEAHLIRKTYERIVKRLEDERVGFNSQLAAIERTLDAKRNDYEELVQLHHDAQHSKQLAMQELTNFKSYLEEERKLYQKQLKEREQYYQSRTEMTEKLQERERQRQEIEAEARGELTEKRAQELKTKAVTGMLERSVNEQKNQEFQAKIHSYEEAFRKIKEATGVSDVNEVTQRFMTQEQTSSNLENMLQDSQHRIEELNKEKVNLKRKLDEIKFSGTANYGSRRMIDEFENQLQSSEQTLDRNREKYERSTKLLLGVKSGVEHLVEIINIMSGGMHEHLPQLGISNDALVTTLGQIETQLSQVCSSVRSTSKMAQEQPADAESEEEADDNSVASADESLKFMLSTLNQNNLRISLNAEAERFNDEEEGEEADASEVLDRDQIKKMSTAAVEKHKKKKHRKGVRKVRGKGKKEDEN